MSSASEVRSFRVLGTELVVTTYADLRSQLLVGMAPREVSCVDFSNTHTIALRRHSPEFRRLTADLSVVVPDGMPLVWVMNLMGADLRDRVYGPTFTRKFLETCPAARTHYLIGGSPECGQRLREAITLENPKIRFVGWYHGACGENGELTDQDRIFTELKTIQPDFIWIGLGTPKQYALAAKLKGVIRTGTILTVGFAFDVIAGTKKDAPPWMQRAGLTWLFRLTQEPRRLIGRYLKYNTLFCFYLIKDSIRIQNSGGNPPPAS